MRESTVARTYAEVLFDLGERGGRQDEFSDALDAFVAVVDAEPRVRTFLNTPQVEPAEKKRVLADVMRDRTPDAFLNFVRTVIDKRRQRLFPEIATAYHALLDERLGRVRVGVTLAREPDGSLRENIRTSLSEKLDRDIVAQYRVDPAILGGVIVRYGDRVIDGSMRRRLVRLKQRMLRADLPAATK